MFDLLRALRYEPDARGGYGDLFSLSLIYAKLMGLPLLVSSLQYNVDKVKAYFQGPKKNFCQLISNFSRI